MKKTWIIKGLSLVFGAAIGWGYWHFFGCAGSCAITSSPINSTLYGAVLGILTINIFLTSDETNKKRNEGV